MAISFRGTASRLKQMTEKRNPAGFQEKSAAGPRDGVGGEKVTVEQAAKRFAKRKSPFKLNKNFYGGEAYFSDGYSGPLKKSQPITQKSSPFKINMALVQGAADVYDSKKFNNPADAVASGFEQKDPEPMVLDIGQCQEGQYKDTKGNCLQKPNCEGKQVFNPTSGVCEDPEKEIKCGDKQIKDPITGACVDKDASPSAADQLNAKNELQNNEE